VQDGAGRNFGAGALALPGTPNQTGDESPVLTPDIGVDQTRIDRPGPQAGKIDAAVKFRAKQQVAHF